MPYLILSANNREILRRELTGPLVIGRAPDCDVPVRDILLSRHHCRIEPIDDGKWQVIDLKSRNGTLLNDQRVERHVLEDSCVLGMGRTTMCFCAGAFEPGPELATSSPDDKSARQEHLVRPTDPEDALSGTLSGFELVLPDEVERTEGAPVPQPRPREPKSYQSENVYGMLKDIVSSSWDSIQETNARPVLAAGTSHGRVALSLQADLKPRRPARRPALPPKPGRKSRGRAMSLAVGITLPMILVGAWLFMMGAASLVDLPTTVKAQMTPSLPDVRTIAPVPAAPVVARAAERVEEVDVTPVADAEHDVAWTGRLTEFGPHLRASKDTVQLLVALEILY